MALKTGEDEQVASATDPVQAAPPPPAAGQEGGIFGQVSQVAQQSAQASAQQAQIASPAPKPPKLTTLPKGQQLAPIPTSPIPAFDFNHDSFDGNQFNQRFQNTVQKFRDEHGVNPSLSVAHDLTRSGLSLNAIGEIAQHIGQVGYDPTGSYVTDTHELPADWLHELDGNELAQLHSKPIVAVQNAPWQGLKWDGEKWLANLNEAGPTSILKREIQKSLQTPMEALAFLNDVRRTNPAEVATAMRHIQNGDFLEAAAKVRDALGVQGAVIKNRLTPEINAANQAAQDTILGIANSALRLGADTAKLTHQGVWDQAQWDTASKKGDLLGMIQALTPVKVGADLAGLPFESMNLVSRMFENTARNEGAPEPVVQAAKYAGTILTIIASGGTKGFGPAANAKGLARLNPIGQMTGRQIATKAGVGGLFAEHAAENEDPNAGTAQKIIDVGLAFWMGTGMTPKSLQGLSKPELAASNAIKARLASVNPKEIIQASMDKSIQTQTDAWVKAQKAADDHHTAAVKPARDAIDAHLGKTGELSAGKTPAEQTQHEANQARANADAQRMVDQINRGEEPTVGAQESPAENQAQIDRNEQANAAQRATIEAREARLRADTPAARAIADRELARAQAAQQKLQDLNRTGGTGEPMARAMDEMQQAQGATSDATTKPDPVLAKLQKTHDDAMEHNALLQAVADRKLERMSRQIAGDTNTEIRQTSKAIAYHLDFAQNDTPVEYSGINHVQAARILSQNLGDGIRRAFKTIGDTPENRKLFITAMEHPEIIPQLEPAMRQLVTDMQAHNAMMAARIPDTMKNEMLDAWTESDRAGETKPTGLGAKKVPVPMDYYPRGAGLSIERFERTIRSDNPLPVNTSHLKPRVIPEDSGAAPEHTLHPADEYDAYSRSMSQALINMRVRSAIKDAHISGKPIFIDASEPVPPDNGLKYTKSSLSGMEGWLETKTHDHLQDMARPAGHGVAILDKLATFQAYYKKMAMTSLQHFWNQFSGSSGVAADANIPNLRLKIGGKEINIGGSLVKRGQDISHDPAAMAVALDHVFAQPDRWIGEVADDMVSKNTQLSPMLDALRKIENQTYGRFEHHLWTSNIRNVQLGIHSALREKLAVKYGDKYTQEEYDAAAASMAGQITGIMSPEKLARWERVFQRYLAFAYMWNRKHATITTQSLPVIGSRLARTFDPTLSDKSAHLVTELSRDYLNRYTATTLASFTAMSMLTGGQPWWENDKGHEFDLNWTRIHDLLYGSDGKQHYLTYPPMMFANFFHSKAQVYADALSRSGNNWGQGLIQGTADNLANITMPVPSWAIQTIGSAFAGTEDISSLLGRSYQSVNPYNRNYLAPIAKADTSSHDLLADIGTGLGGFLGLKTYTGEHRPFSPPRIVNEEARATALVLARMGIDPATASDAQREEANRQLYGNDLAGININQVAQAIAGKSQGTGSVYKDMNTWADQTINNALIEAGATQAQIDKARADGGDPLHLLTPLQERKMFEMHPELQFILNAPPVSDDPNVIKQHADLTKYNVQLSHTYSVTADQQKAIDAEYEAGKITLNDWKSKLHDLHQREKGAIDAAWSALTADEQAKLSKSPQQKAQTDPVLASSPLLAEEQAYWQYRQIAATGNYDLPDGSISSDLRTAQNAYMKNLPTDLQQYILERERSTQTPLQQKYYAAADKYGQFKQQNAQWEEIRSAYDSMPKFQRDLLKDTYPDFSQYMKYRENYFKENQDVADFYHLTDFKAYQQKPKLVQAMDVADYFVTHYGKHPEFNSPWADSVVTDPNVWAQVTAGWDQATYNQFLGAYNGYYQNQAEQRAKFHDFLTQLFARRRTVKTSSGTGSVLGG